MRPADLRPFRGSKLTLRSAVPLIWKWYFRSATLGTVAMIGHNQRLLVPKTEEKRCAPWLDLAGDAPGDGGALRGGGAGSGAATAGRS
jgi:hypothetical protein